MLACLPCSLYSIIIVKFVFLACISFSFSFHPSVLLKVGAGDGPSVIRPGMAGECHSPVSHRTAPAETTRGGFAAEHEGPGKMSVGPTPPNHFHMDLPSFRGAGPRLPSPSPPPVSFPFWGCRFTVYGARF